MAHTYVSELIHCVFSTKQRRNLISAEVQRRDRHGPAEDDGVEPGLTRRHQGREHQDEQPGAHRAPRARLSPRTARPGESAAAAAGAR